MTTMQQHAEHYRRLGWSIYPIQPRTKRPLVPWREFQNRQPTAVEVSQWYLRWPDAGIAVVLGPVSSIVVVDVDSLPAEERFSELLGGVPSTLTALSGSRSPGKKHYYFQAPDFPTTARYTPLHPQLEFRGQGGSVVLPPSLHASGNCYQWCDESTAISALPEPLAEVWRANPRFSQPEAVPGNDVVPTASPADLRSLRSILHTRGLSDETQGFLQRNYAFQSGWNSRLFRAACDMNGCGVPFQQAMTHLLRGASPRTDADREQAIATIESAYSVPRLPRRTYHPRQR